MDSGPTAYASRPLGELSLDIGGLSVSILVLLSGLGQDLLFQGQVANLSCLAAVSLRTCPEVARSVNCWGHRCIEQQSINDPLQPGNEQQVGSTIGPLLLSPLCDHQPSSKKPAGSSSA
jgi:hypothetical protein